MAEGPDIHDIPPVLMQFLVRGLKIPPCPAVLSQLSQAVQNPDTQPNELARLIKLDPALTTAILRVANSALYGASRQIATIETAVLRLGFQEVLTIAVGLKSKEFLSTPKLSLFSAWLYEHSLRTGFLHRRLGRGVNPKFAELYLTAGILHDIGRMVLAQIDPAYAKFCLNIPMLLKEDQTSVLLEEKNRWGNDHTEIGAALCEFWDLPDILQTMIKEHHADTFTDRSTGILRVSDLWSVILTAPTRVPPKICAKLLETRICPKADMTPAHATLLGQQADQEVAALMNA